MALLSGTFLWLLTLVTLAVVAATALVWPRLSRRAVLPVAGRVALVLSCQVLAVLLAATAVNRTFDFYASWAELVPHSASTDAVAATPVAPVKGRPTPPPRPYAGVADLRPGRLLPITVPGTGGLKESGLAYLPPQYDEPAHRHERFPAVLVLAGYPGHVLSLVNALGLPGAMNRGLAAGTVRPMVMVMMSPTVVPPRDTECADVPKGPQVESYLAKDVPAWVAAHLRTSGTTAVLGASTGGFCAIKLATRHPAQFLQSVALSGYIHPLEDATTGELYGRDRALRQHSDAIWLLQHGPSPRVSYLLAASRTEHQVYPQLLQFAAALRPPASLSTIVLPSGGHNYGVWRTELPAALRWLSARVAGAMRA